MNTPFPYESFTTFDPGRQVLPGPLIIRQPFIFLICSARAMIFSSHSSSCASS